MRVAIAGKGGAGKTTIAATAARLSARSGRPVVAVDADSNPNLAVALGAGTGDGAVVSSLPASLVSRRLDRPGFTQSLDDILTEHALAAPDGVRLVAMGAPHHAEQGCLCSAHAVVSTLLAELGNQPDTLTVVDMEASPEHLSRGTARHADVLLLVAEPYYRALEAVGRLAALARELPITRVAVVANKVRSPEDADAIAAYCDRHSLEHIATVAWSDDVLDADRGGRSVLDAAPDSPVVRAVRDLLIHIGAS
jgi:CO dehydrogenase maturation factor